ncbi:flagellin lysine-N-methylase [Bacillus cereus]|uniref:Lysine-N-methylase n=1 Tax=Bacillus cereus TaxID=1396 RepID=A0A9X7B7C7_BACCE|nr:flagellin lysine-N-methylase [Bacillus cereus]PED43155.1 hypothetical protein CON26_15955 [Bacillus cereus]PFV02849.1 hypothetical protein COK98_25820 [Bacillus cereus]
MKQNFFTSKHTSQFSCIGSECEDNCCCTDWTVFVNKEKYELYQKMDQEKSSDILHHVEKNNKAMTEEDYAILKFNSTGVCSFLTEEKLCKLQIEHGYHTLCNTCKHYPRVNQKVHHTYYETGHISCPEMARLVLLSENPFEWIASMNRDSKESLLVPYSSPSNLNYVKKMHTHMTHFLKQKEFSLSQRIWLIGIFINEFYNSIQKKIGTDKAIKQAQKQVNSEMKNKPDSFVQLKIQVILKTILKIANDLKEHSESPRLQECLQLFKEGMGIKQDEDINMSEFLHTYKKNYDGYYKQFFSKHEHILENYCLYYFQHTIFPYDNKKLAKRFLFFNIEFSILKLILVGISASTNQLNESIVIQLFQSYSKIFQHNSLYKKECIGGIHDELLKYTTDFKQLTSILISE